MTNQQTLCDIQKFTQHIKIAESKLKVAGHVENAEK